MGQKKVKLWLLLEMKAQHPLFSRFQVNYLKELSHDDFLFLFAKHAFDGGNSNAYPKLEVIGRKIVKKCDGLPSTVEVLGGLMQQKERF